MYLSRVEIDTNNRRSMRDLGHLGCYHGWIEDAFPEERVKAKDERTRKLWRVDNIDGKYYLLLLSETKPDFALLEKYGVKHSAMTKAYDPFVASLMEGMRANFRIKLNTVKAYSDRENFPKRGRVVPVRLDELIPFFMDRAEKNGFSVEPDEIGVMKRDEELWEHKGEGDGKRTKLNLVSATYEGILTITDLEKFKVALQYGIGKKKAYGFGLLTIIPIP